MSAKVIQVYTKFCVAWTTFSMLESSDRPFQCEIQAMIKFLNIVHAREIHRRLCTVYRKDNVKVEHKVYR